MSASDGHALRNIPLSTGDGAHLALPRPFWRPPPEPANRSLLRSPKTWAVITILWGTLGLASWLLEFALSFGGSDGTMTLGRAAARLVYAALWLSVTVFAIWVCERATLRHFRQYLKLTFHVGLGVAVAVSWATLAYYINLAIIPGWAPLGLWRMISTTFMTSYFYYLGLIALVHSIIHARDVRVLEKTRSSVQAELQALKMELQPHFLFNTLHAISALMHRDVKAANEMLVLLADMLEIALQNMRDQEVTLGEEIETLKLYVRIQQIRFSDRLRAYYDIDDAAVNARVPHFIFQPLVENAIKHGIADRASGGTVRLSARVVDDRLQLAVQDDGLGLKDERQAATGLGLTNTRERLAFLYGDRHRFRIRNGPEGGVLVELAMPLRWQDTVDSRR